MPPPRIARTVARGKPKPNLRRRAQHLAFVRQLSCVAGGKAAPQRPRMCARDLTAARE